MKRSGVLWLMIYCTLAIGAEQKTSETHTFKIPVAPRSKSISLNVINDNGHTITQYNSSNLRVDAPSLSPATSGQSSLLARAISSLWSYKLAMAAGVVCAGYTALLSALLYLEHMIMQGKGWANWHQELSLETLNAVDQQMLAKELFEDIKHCYLPPSYTALNFLDPIVCFINECDHEMKTLERFIQLHDWISKIHISYYLPTQEQTVAKTLNAIARLKYVKRLLVLYLSEYQIDA
ncbi:MAG TPA: hypothetical protein VFF04_03435 [Candidatus Babeliales bacterium]|nr:hypothetical protein [Candidatus Babeliales bacterium]